MPAPWAVPRAHPPGGRLRALRRLRRRQLREAAERIARETIIRPEAVVVGREGEEYDRLAGLPVPDHASGAARQVADAVALLASERLLRGDALDFALCRVAAGRDLIVRTLATLGVTLDRKTVAHALAELVDLGVLDRVGQLDGWMDMQPKGGPLAKRGAYVHALKVFCRKLGDWYQDAVQRARDRLVGGVPHYMPQLGEWDSGGGPKDASQQPSDSPGRATKRPRPTGSPAEVSTQS